MKPFLLLALLALAGYTSAQAKQGPMFYYIAVQFNPDSSYIHGQVEIQNPTDSCFFLARGLKIQSVMSDGKSVHLTTNLSGGQGESH